MADTDADPLRDSAPLTHGLALRMCGEAPNGGTCVWNHGLWQYLRLFGMITTPVHRAQFYAGVFTSVAVKSGGGTRVLISGAADYGMLAQVLRAFRGVGVTPAVTVLDACETPLEACRWYAAREGCTIQTHCSNILDYEAAQGFDAVCTHSFLGQFDDRERGLLAAKWFDLLRPGGCVATVNRVRPGRRGVRVGFTPEQAQWFVKEVSGHVDRAELPAGVNAAVLKDMAREYSEKFAAWAVDSEADIRSLFERAGFQLEVLASDAVGKASADGRDSGPSTPGGASYARILAIRPA